MSECREIRWQLNEFLAGKLDQDRDEAVRSHLDVCSRCVGMLTIGHRIDNHLRANDSTLPADFSKKVVGEFPVLGVWATVIRYLFAVFGASAAFAALAYWTFSQFFSRGNDVIAGQLAARPETLSIVVSEWLANPAVRYIGLALLAVVLTAALVLLVDSPRQSRREKA